MWQLRHRQCRLRRRRRLPTQQPQTFLLPAPASVSCLKHTLWRRSSAAAAGSTRRRLSFSRLPLPRSQRLASSFRLNTRRRACAYPCCLRRRRPPSRWALRALARALLQARTRLASCRGACSLRLPVDRLSGTRCLSVRGRVQGSMTAASHPRQRIRSPQCTCQCTCQCQRQTQQIFMRSHLRPCMSPVLKQYPRFRRHRHCSRQITCGAAVGLPRSPALLLLAERWRRCRPRNW